MSFATEIVKSVSAFRVLVDIDSVDGTWSGRYSFDSFVPDGSAEYYDGRLLSAPKITMSRDSNYFGLLTYSSSSIRLINADGGFDDLFDTHNVIGAMVKVYIGYANLDISEYVNIYTGYVESGSVSEEALELSVGDLKKRLGTYNTQDLKFVNAIQGIEDTLNGTYGSAANVYASAWSVAKTLSASTATIFRTHPAVDTVSQVIEDCAKSTMGFFYITGEGEYSYKLLDTSATAISVIVKEDVLAPISLDYSEGTILGSTEVNSPAIGLEQGYSVLIPGVQSYSRGVYCDGVFLIPVVTGTSDSTYRSIDNGMVWTQSSVMSPIGSYILTTTDKTLLYTSGYKIYRSADNGASWAMSASSASYFTYATLAETVEGYIITGRYTVGNTFAFCRALAEDSSTYTTMQVIGDMYSPVIDSSVTANGRVRVGTAGTTLIAAATYIATVQTIVFRSQDSGSSWSVMHSITGGAVSMLRSVSDRVWVMSCETGAASSDIYYSEDYGSSWTIVQTVPAKIQHFEMSNDHRLMALCYPYKNVVMESFPDIYGNPGKVWDYAYQLNAATSAYNEDTDTMLAIGREDPDVSTSLSVYISRVSSNVSLNATYQASTYSAYKVDTTKYYPTVLAYNADAATLAGKLAVYYKDCHGTFSVTVPMKYYSLGIGDLVDVEIWRETTSMLGTKKCEVMGLRYDLEKATIQFDMRIV